MSRPPKPGGPITRHCIGLTQDAEDILAAQGITNLSEYFDSMVRANAGKSPDEAAIEADALERLVLFKKQDLLHTEAKLSQLSSQCRMAAAGAQDVEAARLKILDVWRARLKAPMRRGDAPREIAFTRWLEHRTSELKVAHFASPADALAWCVSQLSTKQATVPIAAVAPVIADAPPTEADTKDAADARSKLLEMHQKTHRSAAQLLDALDGWADEVREAGFDDAKAAVDWLMTQPRKLQPTVQTASKGGI